MNTIAPTDASWVRVACKAEHQSVNWITPGQLAWATWLDTDRTHLVVAIDSDHRAIVNAASFKHHFVVQPVKDDAQRAMTPSAKRKSLLSDVIADAVKAAGENAKFANAAIVAAVASEAEAAAKDAQ